MSFHIYTSSGPGRYDRSYADSLSTNLFLVEADRNDRFADGAFNFDDALYCLRARNRGKRCYLEKHRQVRETTLCIDNFCGSRCNLEKTSGTLPAE